MRLAEQNIFLVGFDQEICDIISAQIKSAINYDADLENQYDYYFDHERGAVVSGFKGISCNGFTIIIRHWFSNKVQRISVYNLGAGFHKWMEADFSISSIYGGRNIFLFCFEFSDFLKDFLPFEGLNRMDIGHLKLNMQNFLYKFDETNKYTVVFFDKATAKDYDHFLESFQVNNLFMNGMFLRRLITESDEHLGIQHYLRLPTLLVSEEIFSLNFLRNYF